MAPGAGSGWLREKREPEPVPATSSGTGFLFAAGRTQPLRGVDVYLRPGSEVNRGSER
jgi:hypothetical protein